MALRTMQRKRGMTSDQLPFPARRRYFPFRHSLSSPDPLHTPSAYHPFTRLVLTTVAVTFAGFDCRRAHINGSGGWVFLNRNHLRQCITATRNNDGGGGAKGHQSGKKIIPIYYVYITLYIIHLYIHTGPGKRKLAAGYRRRRQRRPTFFSADYNIII